MERDEAKKIIESLLYMTDHALSEIEIGEVLEQKRIDADEIKLLIKEIGDKYAADGSPLCVVEVAGGYQIATRPEMAPFIRKLYKERLTVRLSPSSLETLSIIAYKQPISRSEIEQIRGVEVSGVMETLVERRLIKVVGRKETIGRPLLYGTTVEFLRHFGLKHLADLPDINTLVPAESVPDASMPANVPVEELPLEEPQAELVGVTTNEGVMEEFPPSDQSVVTEEKAVEKDA